MLMAGDDLAPLARTWGIPLVWLGRRNWVGPESLVNLWRRLRGGSVDLLLLLTAVPNIWGKLLGRLAGVPLIVSNCRGACRNGNMKTGSGPWEIRLFATACPRRPC